MLHIANALIAIFFAITTAFVFDSLIGSIQRGIASYRAIRRALVSIRRAPLAKAARDEARGR